MEESARLDQPFRRLLDMEDAGTCRHPLRIAVGDDATAAVRIGVLEDPIDHVGHGLEAAMRVPWRALRLTGRVFHLAHLVEMDERIEVLQRHPGERAPDREPLPLEPAWRVGDGADRPIAGDGRIRLADAGKNGDVGGDDGGHVRRLLGVTAATRIPDK